MIKFGTQNDNMSSHVDNLKNLFVSKLRLWNFMIILPSHKDSPIKTIIIYYYFSYDLFYLYKVYMLQIWINIKQE